MPGYCDGCGAPATANCPYCRPQVYSCDECAPICDHDARNPKRRLAPLWSGDPPGSECSPVPTNGDA